MEISLAEVLEILFKRKKIMLVCLALFTLGSIAITNFVIDKEYTASVSLYVQPNKESSNQVASLNELYYAKEVVNTYIEILRTGAFTKAVAKASNLEYSSSELSKMITISNINKTEIFKIEVTTTNPKHSYILAKTISNLAPDKIIEIKNADAVVVVDPASLPKAPSAPNKTINTLIGIMLGLIIGTIMSVTIDVMDKRIKNEEDLLRHYNVPVLGMIPKIKG